MTTIPSSILKAEGRQKDGIIYIHGFILDRKIFGKMLTQRSFYA